MALKSVAKTAKAPQVWEFDEASHVEGSKDDSDDEEMTFIIKREKNDDQKGCFNCKKPGHFITDCDELDNEEDSEKDEEQANLALMALISSKAESDSYSGSESEEEDEI
ncbi:hypothetical protein KIW84_044710 [Lathyrus oleraceus]|uniref:CCHC-type domain-containing protein n=1 Tax=Pisum sativum TaxID=3888 RepID=A0A9D4XIG1_PEA|nr:hypothetical protein KIW84_044710 [Pisum sativum]